jgi:hypothetical protein
MEPREQRSDIEARLRAASDAIQIAVVELRALEAQKRSIEPNDERFVELATRIRGSAEHLLERTRAEETFAGELASEPSAADIAPIVEVQPPHELREILEEWREVERELNTARAGSPEAHRLLSRFEQQRAENMRANGYKQGQAEEN